VKFFNVAKGMLKIVKMLFH